MKGKYFKALTLVVLFSMSATSYLYLNYNLAPSTQKSCSKIEVEKKDSSEDTVLLELSLIKLFGKRLIDVVTFTI